MGENIQYNKDKRFDFNLDPNKINGELMEATFAKYLTATGITFEIKSESHYKWMNSGNIYIEIEQFIRGNWEKSGLSSTQAELWVHIIKDENDEPLFTITISVDKLKKRIKKLIKNDCAFITGKPETYNGTATRGVIIPLKHLLFTDFEQEEYQKKKNLKNIQRINELFASR